MAAPVRLSPTLPNTAKLATNIIYGFAISGRSVTLKRTVKLQLVGKQYAIDLPLIFGKTVMEVTIGLVYSVQPYGYVNFYKHPEEAPPSRRYGWA